MIIEKMSDTYTKYHLPFMDAVIHHFTGPDLGYPHDHPFNFRSVVLKGSYIESIYHYPSTGTEEIHRLEGSTHFVEAETIHKIICLPEGECWTMIFPQNKIREPGFWKIENNIIKHYKWYEK